MDEDDDQTHNATRQLTPHHPSLPFHSYASAYIGGNSRPILGNVIHHHTHFHDGRQNARSPPAPSEDRNLPVLKHGGKIDPDAISNYDSQYAWWLRSQLRLQNTCQWICNAKETKRWRDNSGPPILVCTGSVGSGKSVTASAMIDYLQSGRHEEAHLVASYFVDAFDDEPVTTVKIVCALIKQLFSHIQSSSITLSADAKAKMEALFLGRLFIPNLPLLTEAMWSLLESLNYVVFVVDGLDALSENEASAVFQFLSSIFPSNRKAYTHKAILFSRDILGRSVSFDRLANSETLQIGIHHVRRDIETYIEHEVKSRQSKDPITDDVKLIEEVVRTLKAHSAKMFLWTQLQLCTLWDPDFVTCDEDIRTQLTSLPEKLEDFYIKCLRRIDSTNTKRSRDIAPMAFRWVASARTPLTQAQAKEAVSMNLYADNIPCKKSKLLQRPVEEYCANLLVLDKFTGKIVFPHPSVKDFLRDDKKLPPDLSAYGLCTTEDDLWCGRTCMTYIREWQAQNQVVRYKTPQVRSNVVMPILKSISGSVFANLQRKPADSKLVTLPAPNQLRPQGLDHVESVLRGYIQSNWLSYFRFIEGEHPNNQAFAELCLQHDSRFQPWSGLAVKGVQYYQAMVQYAIVEDHYPLVRLVLNHLKEHKPATYKTVVHSPCPGTSSSWLHIAAALGNQKIAMFLLAHCNPRVVDDEGNTFLAIAAKAGLREIFDLYMLLSDSPLWFTEELFEKTRDFVSTGKWEHVLRLSARYGMSNTYVEACTAIEKCSDWSAYLCDAILHAAYYSQARYISELWIYLNPQLGYRNDFQDRVTADRHHDESFFQKFGHRSSQHWLQMALEIGNPTIMATLLASEPQQGFFADDIDIPDVLNYFDGDIHHEAEPFVRLLVARKRVIKPSVLGKSCSWLQRLLLLAFHSAVGWGGLLDRNQILRFILDSYPFDDEEDRRLENSVRACFIEPELTAGTATLISPTEQVGAFDRNVNHSDQTLEFSASYISALNTFQEFHISEMFFDSFSSPPSPYILLVLDSPISGGSTNSSGFDTAKDQPALSDRPAEQHVRRVKRYVHPWVAYLTDDIFLRMLRKRWIQEDTLLQPESLQALGRRKTSRMLEAVIQQSGFDQVWTNSAALSHAPSTENEFLDFFRSTKATCSNRERRASDRDSECSHQYILHELREDLNIDSRTHLKDMLDCYCLTSEEVIEQQCINTRPEHEEMTELSWSDLVKQHVGENVSLVKPSRLMWLRCLRMSHGDVATAVNRCVVLLRDGADGNFELNFPGAFDLEMLAKTTPLAGSITEKPVRAPIRHGILFALLRWNFRINRRKHRPFSEADINYCATVISSALKQHRRLEMDTTKIAMMGSETPRRGYAAGPGYYTKGVILAVHDGGNPAFGLVRGDEVIVLDNPTTKDWCRTVRIKDGWDNVVYHGDIEITGMTAARSFDRHPRYPRFRLSKYSLSPELNYSDIRRVYEGSRQVNLFDDVVPSLSTKSSQSTKSSISWD